MAILNYGSKDVAVSFGGTDVTAMLFPDTELERRAILQKATPFGVAWPVFLDTGSRELSPLQFGGIEDFTAVTGTRAIFAEGTSGELVVTYGGTKTTTVTCLGESYKSTLADQKLHVCVIKLQPTGTVVEA